MQIIYWLFLGIAATILLNLGKGVSKYGLKRMGEKKKSKKKYGVIWIGGIFITASSVFLNYFALDMGEASVIAALAGIGLIAVIIFSYYILDEKLDKIIYIGIGLTIIGTVIVGIFTIETHQEYINFGYFWIFFAIGIVFLIIGMIYSFTHKYKFFGFVFGGAAGLFSGFGVVMEKMGLIINGGAMEFFENPFSLGNIIIYLAILIGLGATAFTQYGLSKGKASIVIPAYNSLYIIIPLMCELIVFYTTLAIPQYIGIIIIIIGIFLMTAIKPVSLDTSIIKNKNDKDH